MEILLVEDGLLDARVTILALRRSHIHHRLTLVRTVAEAIQFLKRDGIFSRAPRPDLLLLDLMLPDGSGLEILESMNGLEGMIKTTVVVLSASDDPSVRQRSDELGVHDFIPKPVSEEEFLRVVREHKRWMIRSTPVFQTV
jgi:CheY-like chemotaxis protein